VNRRDFFRLVRRGRQRVLELSCERLYVRWVDAEGRSTRIGRDDGASEGGEPPTRIAAESCADLLAELDGRLAAADVLRLVGDEWLQSDELRRGVHRQIDSFERRGGKVERPKERSHAGVVGPVIAGLLAALLATIPVAADAQAARLARTPTDLRAPALSLELPDQTASGRSASRTIAIHGLVGTGAGLLIGLALSSADISDDKTASVVVWTLAGAAAGIGSGVVTWLMDRSD
jgi:hypothetical protein